MSSEKDLIIIKGGNTFQRISRKTFKAMPRRLWREETPKRSASRSKLSVDKKIKKIDKTNKLRTDQKTSKRRQQQQQKQEEALLEVPNPPHNTTQYLISTNTDALDTQNLYTQTDRFEYDFQHHAMAGSMMDLMRDKFMHMYDQSTTAPSTQETPLEEDFVEEKEEVTMNPYSMFLKQAESGENLQDLVKQLVDVLVQKDQEIGVLQASLNIVNTEKR